MGMAVGVDYSLFYLKREREERAAGHEGTTRSSGRGNLRAGGPDLRGDRADRDGRDAVCRHEDLHLDRDRGDARRLRLAGRLADRAARAAREARRPHIERGLRQVLAADRPAASCDRSRHDRTGSSGCARRRRCCNASRADRQESRLWGFVITRSMRHPALAVGVSTGAAGRARAAGALNLHTKLSSFTDLPKSLSIVKTYDTIQASFPGSQDPAHLVVKADDVTTPQFAKAYAEFKKRALATGVIQQPIRVTVNNAKTVARVDFPLAGKGRTQRRCGALDDSTHGGDPARAGDAAGRHRAGRDRRHRSQRRLQQDDEVTRADRVRVRARLRLPAAAR